ncbi:MAG: 4-hydroxy-3-methylbut-2-enyl diphosphate reductase, partial [Clostridia bacterium]|nr:4-hydroxy-3-methylbut-2-enyl diphosphate reductase [Clostridia bacterium]
MQVHVAKSSGFCRGVQNAVDTAMSVKPENMYILGEIIHNADVTRAIEARGIKVVEQLSEVPDGATVIFRSHGVPAELYTECDKRQIRYIDCTCKFVRNTQNIVKRAYDEGKTIVICGEPSHPEVIGLQGWCGNSALVIDRDDADLSCLIQKDVCIVAQTTFSVEKFEKIIKIIKKLCEKSVAVFKTICYTTICRQMEAKQLSSVCDAMLVIGGLNSSNTNKLYDICKNNCGNVIRLASAADFNFETIKNFKNIGIVSGASTPNAQTREVLLKMEEKSTEVIAANSMEEVVAKIENESKFKKGQIVTATISEATADGLQILLPFSKKEIPLSKDELDCEVYSQEEYAGKIGDTIDLLVVELKPSLKLSQKMIKLRAVEEAQIADIEQGKEFQIECTGSNKGGLVGHIGTYSVFVPAKEIRPGFVKDLAKYEGKTLRLRA